MKKKKVFQFKIKCIINIFRNFIQETSYLVEFFDYKKWDGKDYINKSKEEKERSFIDYFIFLFQTNDSKILNFFSINVESIIDFLLSEKIGLKESKKWILQKIRLRAPIFTKKDDSNEKVYLQLGPYFIEIINEDELVFYLLSNNANNQTQYKALELTLANKDFAIIKALPNPERYEEIYWKFSGVLSGQKDSNNELLFKEEYNEKYNQLIDDLVFDQDDHENIVSRSAELIKPIITNWVCKQFSQNLKNWRLSEDDDISNISLSDKELSESNISRNITNFSIVDDTKKIIINAVVDHKGQLIQDRNEDNENKPSDIKLEFNYNHDRYYQDYKKILVLISLKYPYDKNDEQFIFLDIEIIPDEAINMSTDDTNTIYEVDYELNGKLIHRGSFRSFSVWSEIESFIEKLIKKYCPERSRGYSW
ncbi:hypothetical protein [Mycoplasma sp. E35C]|uniref:hypothetical protein n=1 Tax=Mycoplasma sp. E35C TaxID=2801918 RepID=UPI001CA3C324|nr:hypothetical protein [Mycoplasma sp. E35C]QZX49403.1 hypothetical protein JJE79_01495 [Mycoplasma sp. E35C]